MGKQLNNDILNEFSRKMNIDQTERNQFVEKFQSVFEEALLRDKLVKINGLGTFKLVEVSPRKSVDVNTGEEIEIAGHYKLNFIPEATLKEMVNQPLSHLEVVELNDEDGANNTANAASTNVGDLSDPLHKLTEQAMELKDMLDDIQGKSDEQSVVENKQDDMHKIKENKVSPIKTETMNANDNKQNVQQRVQVNTTKVNTPSPFSARSMVNSANLNKKKVQKNHTWVWILVAILLVLAIAGILAYLYWDKIVPAKDTTVEVVAVDTTKVVEEKTVIVEPESNIDKTNELYSAKFSDKFNRKREYKEFIDNVSLNEGSRLALLSYRYYGAKDFWVYIYEANKDIVADPNKILVGTKVRIPKLDKELIDASNAECISYAHYLHELYVKRNK